MNGSHDESDLREAPPLPVAQPSGSLSDGYTNYNAFNSYSAFQNTQRTLYILKSIKIKVTEITIKTIYENNSCR